MFVQLLFGLLFAGTMFIMLDMLPIGGANPFFYTSMKYVGVICIWMGPLLYYVRDVITGAHNINEMPNPLLAKIIHMGKSSGRIMKAKKVDPNRLICKTKTGYMNIKDTGDPINIAGHDLFITSQDIGHNIPVWLCDLIDKWKTKYGVRNEDEWSKLYEKIKNIKSYADLENIEFLKPVMADPEKRKLILDMDLDDLRNMRERLYDGRVINAKAYIGWSEGATPYDNESIISSTVAHHRAQDMSLKTLGGTGDYMKYIIPLAIILILGAVAYQIFKGG